MAARGVIIIIIAKESRGEGRVDRSVEGQRGGEEKKKKSTRRISGCREAETAAGLWKMVNRLNSSAQLFNFVDYLRSSSFFMSLSRCGIHLWSRITGKGCVYARAWSSIAMKPSARGPAQAVRKVIFFPLVATSLLSPSPFRTCETRRVSPF